MRGGGRLARGLGRLAADSGGVHRVDVAAAGDGARGAI